MNDAYFLRVQVFVFRLMGIDLYSETMDSDRPWLTLFTVGGLTVFLWPMASSIKHNLTDVSRMSDSMGSLLASSLSIIKYLLFVYYRKDLVRLINRIRNILSVEMALLSQAVTIVASENRSDQMLSMAYTRCYFSAGIFAAIKPIVIMTVAYVRTGETKLELPHCADYPWKLDVMLLYVPTYLWNVLASYTAVGVALCVDTLFFALTYNVCAVFKIAQYRMEHMKALTTSPWEELPRLVEILQLHQTGLSIAKQLDNYFRPLIFMQFFISALMMCFIGFQVADLFPKPQFIYFIAFVGSLLIELFIYSYCGENMKKESANFGSAIFESCWYNFALPTKRTLIIAAMRAQRPCQLNGYFFEANMATFSTIVRSAMSYIMMLRSFNA